MKIAIHKTSVSAIVFAVLGILLAQTGCATKRSNNQISKEYYTVATLPLKDTNDLEINTNNMKTKIAPVAAVGFQVAVQVVKALINQEASHYEAVSQASLRSNQPFPGKTGNLIIITRSYAPHKDSKLPSVASQAGMLAAQIDARLHNLGLALALPSGRQTLDVAHSWAKQHHLTNELSFCALVLADRTNDVMDLTLLGYTYPGLKAKNSSIHIPFTTWDKTKSILTVGIESPVGYAAKSFKTSQSFSSGLEWPRKADAFKATAWVPEKYIDGPIFDEGGTSRRVAYSGEISDLPKGPVQIDASLIESSDMKKTLADLATQVGGLKLSDF